MTVLFLRASLAESSTNERNTPRGEDVKARGGVHGTDTLEGVEGRERPTPLNHYRGLCRRGRALRNTPTDGSRAWVPGGRVRVHAHSPHTHVPGCLSPPEAWSSAKAARAAGA